MATNQIKCLECGKVLKLTAPLSPGKRFKCPQCQAIITAPGTTPAVKRNAIAAVPKARPLSTRDDDNDRDDDFDDDDPPRKKSALPMLLVLGGVIGFRSSERLNAITRYRMKRAPRDYHRDDPPIDPRKHIVGRWEVMPDALMIGLLPKVYEFKADGTFVGERDAPLQADKGKYTLEGGNLTLTVGDNFISDKYSVVVTQDRIACVPAGADSRLAFWINQDKPLLLHKLK